MPYRRSIYIGIGINSPSGQQFLQNAAQQLGQEGLQQLLKKLGLD